MYAIVDIAGQQFKVEKQQKLYVHRLEGEAGSKVSFEKVLLIENEGKITVGAPVIKDAAVSAKVIDHLKGDKVLVFKKKRRKGYRKLNGHRQYLTQIEITDIQEKAAKKAAPKAAVKKEAAPKVAATAKAVKPAAVKKPADAKKPAAPKAAAEKKAPAAKAASPAKKTAAAKKPASKKPAAKKPATKKVDGTDKAADKK